MNQIEFSYNIPFHDVDSMGIVWHGRYVKYFELARCELLNSFDYGYKAMQSSGYAWPVVDMRIKYVRPLRFEQDIVIETVLKEWEHRIKVSYIVRDAKTQEKLTTGYTVQVALDMKTEEMLYESPAVLFQKLGLPTPEEQENR